MPFYMSCEIGVLMPLYPPFATIFTECCIPLSISVYVRLFGPALPFILWLLLQSHTLIHTTTTRRDAVLSCNPIGWR